MTKKKKSSLKPRKIVSIDDNVEEQGDSFHRALDREKKDQSENDHECAYDNSPEPERKKVHPSEKLRDRFQKYLQELAVLGFNSGKYDLNAVLVQNEDVHFTIKRHHNWVGGPSIIFHRYHEAGKTKIS